MAKTGSTTKSTGGGGGSSPLTTKGDVYGFSTSGARVPVGADGDSLVADSTQPTGVTYATRVNNIGTVDGSIVVGGTGVNPTVKTGTLSSIANARLASADWSNNSHKITSLADGSSAQDAAAFHQIADAVAAAAIDTIGAGTDITTNNVSTTKHGLAPKAPNDATKYLDGTGAYSVPAGGGGGGAVNSVTAGDTSIVVGGTGTNPTIVTATLDVIATDHAPVAAWSNNSKKITLIADGSSSQDAAAFHQIADAITALSLSSTYQPLDSDLTAIAALTTATYGRSLLTLANEAALYTALGVSTDGTLSGNSDTAIPTQKAVKTYADQLLASASAMEFKGVTDCSANPNYPAGNVGDTYAVSVAGKIGGASGAVVEAGDMFICITINAGGTQASVGVDWVVVQVNINGAVVGPASAVSADFATFSGTTGKIIQDSGLSLSTDGTMASNSDLLVPSQKAVATALALKAPLASPTLTGTPAAPTAAVDTNTTQIATTAMVLAQAASATPLIDGTATVGTSTRFARGDHIHPTDTTRAALASPTLTGTPAGPTAAVDTNTTQLATTAFVLAQAASATPLIDGSATVGTSTRFARGDHIHPTDTTRMATSTYDPVAVNEQLVGLTASQLLTNKRIAPRAVVTNAPGATPSIFANTTDIALFTGVGAAITSMTTSLTSGLPREGQELVIVFTDDGTARAITWGASFEASTIALPTTTVISQRLDVKFRWNVVTSKWRIIDSTLAPVTSVAGRTGAVVLAVADVTGAAPLASPTLTGTPAAPTAAVDTNTTQIATTAMVLAQAASATPLIDGVAAVGTSTRFARGDHVHPTDTTRSALASPTFTGTPAAPTAAVDTNTTQLASTAFVLAQAASATPIIDGTGTVGTSTRFARGDHVHPTDTTRAALASPALTGTPTAPTAAVNTNTTQLATTAFVLGQNGGLLFGFGSDLTAASTITITNNCHRVTGATTINSISGGVTGDIVTLLVMNGQTMTLSGAGNIFSTGSGSNRTVGGNIAITLVLNGNWYVAGVGS